jgi:hypothetical protein
MRHYDSFSRVKVADVQLSHIYPIGNEAIVYRTGYNKRSLCFSRSFTIVQR